MNRIFKNKKLKFKIFFQEIQINLFEQKRNRQENFLKAQHPQEIIKYFLSKISP